MNVQGIVILDVVGVLFIFWILQLVRRSRLYIGYGVIFVITIVSTMITLSVPALLNGVTRLMGALFPVSALTMLALGFIVLLLIYILTQTTILSNRLSKLVQELAIMGIKPEQLRSDGRVRSISKTPEQ
jgi:hypothetical protein